MKTKEQIMQIKELRSQGKTTQIIALFLGVSAHTIAYWVKRLKLSGYDVTTTAKKGRKAIEL